MLRETDARPSRSEPVQNTGRPSYWPHRPSVPAHPIVDTVGTRGTDTPVRAGVPRFHRTPYRYYPALMPRVEVDSVLPTAQATVRSFLERLSRYLVPSGQYLSRYRPYLALGDSLTLEPTGAPDGRTARPDSDQNASTRS